MYLPDCFLDLPLDFEDLLGESRGTDRYDGYSTGYKAYFKPLQYLAFNCLLCMVNSFICHPLREAYNIFTPQVNKFLRVQ